MAYLSDQGVKDGRIEYWWFLEILLLRMDRVYGPWSRRSCMKTSPASGLGASGRDSKAPATMGYLLTKRGASLTGFNHYADCRCGWCVNYCGGSRTNRAQLLENLRERDALHFLKASLARSISGCHVNPNAKCADVLLAYSCRRGSSSRNGIRRMGLTATLGPPACTMGSLLRGRPFRRCR